MFVCRVLETLVKNSIPVVKSSIPVVKNSIPIVKNSIPVVKNRIPVVKNSIPVVKHSIPVVKNSTPVVKNSIPAVKKWWSKIVYPQSQTVHPAVYPYKLHPVRITRIHVTRFSPRVGLPRKICLIGA